MQAQATGRNKLIVIGIAAVGLLILPLVAQQFGNAWVRIIDIALLYVLLALGLNIVVGYAGLLDLGYVAFYAVGAYMFGLLASSQLTDTFPSIAAAFKNGLHTPWWVVIPLGALLAGAAGVLLGAPTLKLRGDYLAIVTLGPLVMLMGASRLFRKTRTISPKPSVTMARSSPLSLSVGAPSSTPAPPASTAPSGMTTHHGVCSPFGNIAAMAGKVSVSCGEASRPNM